MWTKLVNKVKSYLPKKCKMKRKLPLLSARTHLDEAGMLFAYVKWISKLT